MGKYINSIKFLLLSIVVLNVFDGIATTIHVINFGLEIEKNPFMYGFIDKYGLIPFLLLKIIIPVIICSYVYISYVKSHKNIKLVRLTMQIIFFVYSGIALLQLVNFSLYFFLY